MIKIIIPAASVEDAIAIRDRIRGCVLQDDDTVSVTNGGVVITTKYPLRLMEDLADDGFIEG